MESRSYLRLDLEQAALATVRRQAGLVREARERLDRAIKEAIDFGVDPGEVAKAAEAPPPRALRLTLE